MTGGKKIVIIILVALAVLILAVVVFIFGYGTKMSNGNKESVNVSEMKTVPDFKVKDIKGRTVTQAVFSENKLTLVNVWGTYCSTCLEEMPDLEKVYKEYSAKGVSVIGIAEDGNLQEPQVNEILKKTKVTYENLIPSDDFTDDFLSHESGVPYSFTVDSHGKILEFTMGAHSKKEYEDMINKDL